MNTRDFEIFLALSETLHFGKASRTANLSPSALTRSIQRIEDELGRPLFIRDNRNVSLTPAGEQFRAFAQHARSEWASFQETLSTTPSVSGTLSIYASITAIYNLLPTLLETYRAAHPSVHIDLVTGAASEAVEQILSAEIDLAIAALPDRPTAQLQFLPLTKSPLVFIAPKTSEYKNRENFDWSETSLVLPQSGVARTRLDQWLKKERILPNIQSEVFGNEALIAMVRLGCGIGIVPQLVLEKSPFKEKVRILKNAPELEPYTIGLCATKRSLIRPAVQTFWEIATGK